MHAVTMENLEEYLAGTLEPAECRNVETHLNACEMCREEIRGMQEVAGMFRTMRRDESTAWAIAPGFAAKVMEQVGRRKPAPAFASFFALSTAFGRGLVFATLLTVAVLGGYLISHESQFPAGTSPEAILAQQDAPGYETGLAENNMLGTLTAYVEH
jgi:predicted anti-sigma-YlaC factor YlaD